MKGVYQRKTLVTRVIHVIQVYDDSFERHVILESNELIERIQKRGMETRSQKFLYRGLESFIRSNDCDAVCATLGPDILCHSTLQGNKVYGHVEVANYRLIFHPTGGKI